MQKKSFTTLIDAIAHHLAEIGQRPKDMPTLSLFCSVCGDAPCRMMKIEGNAFEYIPEAVIMKAALIAASGLIGQTA